MAIILVIEPSRILQRATALALFPEHEARMVETIPESAGLDNVDAVIVDAGALREAGGLSAQTLHAMEAWNAPMVWIDGDLSEAPKRDKLVFIKRPITKATMCDAVTECLAPKVYSEEGAVKRAGDRPRAPAVKERKVIDLVDVIEAAPAAEPSQSVKQKKK